MSSASEETKETEDMSMSLSSHKDGNCDGKNPNGTDESGDMARASIEGRRSTMPPEETKETEDMIMPLFSHNNAALTTGTSDESGNVAKRARGDEGRRLTMPPTNFEERLRRKMESGGKRGRRDTMPPTSNVAGRLGQNMEFERNRGRRDTMPPTNFQERLMHKFEAERGENGGDTPKKDGISEDGHELDEEKAINNDMHNKFDDGGDCAQESSEDAHKSDEEKATNNDMRNESEDGGECAQESSVTQNDNEEDVDDSHTYIDVIAAQVQVAQPTVAVGEEESQSVVPKIGFDDVFADLQLFKEENGNLLLPTSHLFVSRFIEKLSSHEVEPFLTIVERRASEMQSSSHHSTAPPLARGLLSTFSSRMFLQATLVEDGEEGEVFIAEEVSFWERKWKQFASAMCIFLVLLAVLLSLTLTGVINVGEVLGISEETFQPSHRPSSSPTFDPRSTLEIIQERGYVRCGVSSASIPREVFNLNLCRSIAAVVVGNPDSFEGVPIATSDRWQLLHDRTVDVLIRGDTHTIERETKETTTGIGFAFSSTYTYDGMVYFGNDFFIQCAEEQKRYNDCESLLICVTDTSTHHKFLETFFPSDSLVVGSGKDEIMDMLFNGTCNVAAYDKSAILSIASSDGARDRNFTLGSKMWTKEPLAAVTRNTDREFSDIINWVIQALFYGEEQGLVKDPALCHNYANYTELGIHDGPDLDFMNAVYCVGNYGEIFDGEPNNRGMNQINNGTGMLYAIPFGNLGKANIVDTESTLVKIKNEGSLKCGVVVPDEFVGKVIVSDELVGMGVEYCRIVAAAIFTGDLEGVNFVTFPESQNSSYFALANGEIDVLVGGKVQLKYDFALSPSQEGFHFSTPYYFGNEAARSDASFYSMTTREDDVLFASFVNCIVLATIYAEENRIDRERSREMPLVSVFGSDLNWALRDAIAYSGSYEQIYKNHFGSKATEVNRGRNTLNKGGPMIRSFPGL